MPRCLCSPPGLGGLPCSKRRHTDTFRLRGSRGPRRTGLRCTVDNVSSWKQPPAIPVPGRPEETTCSNSPRSSDRRLEPVRISFRVSAQTPPRSRSSRRPGSAWNHPAPTRAGRPVHGSGAAGRVPPTIDVRRSVNTSVDGSAVSGSIATSEAWRLGDFSGVRWSVGTPAARPLVRRSGPRRRLASERHKSSGRTWPRRAERGHSGGKRGLRRFTSSEPRPRHQAPTSPPSTGCGRSTTGASRQERCDWHSLEHDSSPPRSILRTHWRA